MIRMIHDPKQTMKTRLFLLALPLLSTLNPQLSTCFAQGSLTPPGAPAPTMKTLSQIEPRTPISSLPVTITQSGSYYLTTNLIGVAAQQGISINASDVVLDLNGFALIGVSNSLNGILVGSTRENITIQNGSVRNWGSTGVEAFYSGRNCLFSSLHAAYNGFDGLRAGTNSLVTQCTTHGNAASGIAVNSGTVIIGCSSRSNAFFGFYTDSGCTLQNCVASENAGSGIYTIYGSTITACAARANGSYGIEIGSACLLKDSTAAGNIQAGIHAYDEGNQISTCVARQNFGGGISCEDGNNVVENCTAHQNSSHGIFMSGCCNTVVNCRAMENSGAGVRGGSNNLFENNFTSFNGLGTNIDSGVYVTGVNNRIEHNTTSNNDYGIRADIAGNLIVRNTAFANTTNYFTTGIQNIGPLITTTGAITNTNPWANFSY